MSEEEVLFLSDILPTGYQAAEMGEIKGGETVVTEGQLLLSNGTHVSVRPSQPAPVAGS